MKSPACVADRLSAPPMHVDSLAFPLPEPADDGTFAAVLGMAPADWPIVLPGYAAINVAERDGAVIEVLGLWDARLAVTSSAGHPSPAAARRLGEQVFEATPVAALVSGGRTLLRSRRLSSLGAWPAEWGFSSMHDLWVLCSYLHQRFLDDGQPASAFGLRSRLGVASPPPEQLVVLVAAIRWALAQEPGLSPADQDLAARGLCAGERTLRRGDAV